MNTVSVWSNEIPSTPGLYEFWGSLFWANGWRQPVHYYMNVHRLSWEPAGELRFWFSECDEPAQIPAAVSRENIKAGIWRLIFAYHP